MATPLVQATANKIQPQLSKCVLLAGCAKLSTTQRGTPMLTARVILKRKRLSVRLRYRSNKVGLQPWVYQI